MRFGHVETFACFGGLCSVEVEGSGVHGTPQQAAGWARDQLLAWHRQFSRFLPESELSQLNADPRGTVGASPLMLELAASIVLTGLATEGIVDGTLVTDLERAGYDRPIMQLAPGLDPADEHELEADPQPASPHPAREWSSIKVDRARGTISRPPGVKLDSGGLVKGLLADVLVGWLGSHARVAIDCCDDLAFGGTATGRHELEIIHPLDRSVAHVLPVTGGGVASSSTIDRRWLAHDGTTAHHLLDPLTGRPARTGVIQVTAVAPTALEAEVMAKWALLGGPKLAPGRLPHGGVIIDEAGDVMVVPSGSQRSELVA
jgi:thiamine biosynthesis lipoprotein